jgi:teichuronic acid biosynthesis glycosyltransferase TuaG
MIVPLVSVFMKSYNHERFISEAIESVLRQDFEDLELIIVDDASTDASRQIIERYAKQDSRIRAIFHKCNLGITRVVNDGIEAARGRFIAQIDSDDIWERNKLRKQLAVLENNEDLIVWSEGELIDEAGRLMGKTFSQFAGSERKKKSGDIFQALIEAPFIFGASLLYKRENIGDLRYDERLSYLNDYKFVLELASNYQFCYIDEPLARYRMHGKNTLASRGPEAAKRHRRAYAEEICVRQEALRNFDTRVLNETKAHIYANDGVCYRRLGENRQALSSYLQAIKCNRRSWSNLAYSAHVLELMAENLLGMRIFEEKS